jgi:hypothetical protein
MRRYLLGLTLISGISYGQTTTPTVKEKPVTVAAKYDYVCQKGTKKVTYRISYRDADSLPPCRVYEVINGERRKIAESLKTLDVCEKVIDRILLKLEKEGMECSEKQD